MGLELDGAVEMVTGAAGGIDAVVANAGIGVGGLVEDLVADDWTRSIDVNIRAP